MSLTIVPLHNLDLPQGSRIPFGKVFVLKDFPKWLEEDENILADLGRSARDMVLASRHALISEYYADSLGFPDPDWKGSKPRSIQQLRFQAAFLANIAIWLAQPSQVCFTTGFHALTTLSGGRHVDPPLVVSIENQGPFYCHPRDATNPVLPQHLIKAAGLYVLLEAIPRKNSVWAALRAFSAALLSYLPDRRYPLFWQGLESLFGSETETTSVTPRLKSRISYFLAADSEQQQELFGKVSACYRTRSRIVHGRWDEGLELEDRMADTEAIVRTVVRHIVEKPGMLDVFVSRNRDGFLEAWVQSKAFVAPVI